MRFGAWKHTGYGSHEVNLTSLIDVSLVLVVMLLLATPLAFESSFGVRNETTTAQQSDTQEQNERIEIVVLRDDMVRVNKQELPAADLADMLEPMLASSTDRTVMVGCESGVRHGSFVAVVDQAKLSGATEIAVFER